MDYKELEVEIEKVKAKIVDLENRYAAEEDESKAVKLEYQISRFDRQVSNLIDRQQVLLDKEQKETLKPGNGNDKNVEEDVCPECGSDLYEAEDGLLFCEKCGEYYERE